MIGKNAGIFLVVDTIVCVAYCIFAAVVINFGDANAVVDNEAKSHFTVYNHGSLSATGTLVIAVVPLVLLRAAINIWELVERGQNKYQPNVEEALVRQLQLKDQVDNVENQPGLSVVKSMSKQELKLSPVEDETVKRLKHELVSSYKEGYINASDITESYNKPNRNEQNIWRNQIAAIVLILTGVILGTIKTYRHIADDPHAFGLCMDDDGVTKLDVKSQKCKDDIKALFKSSILFHNSFKNCPAGGADRWEGVTWGDYEALGLNHRLTDSQTHTPWEKCYQGIVQKNKTQSCDLESKPGNQKMKEDQSGLEPDPKLVACNPIFWKMKDGGLLKQPYNWFEKNIQFPVAINFHPKMNERCSVDQECVLIEVPSGANQGTPLARLVTKTGEGALTPELTNLATAKREEIASKSNPYVCLPRLAATQAPAPFPTGTGCVQKANLYLYNPVSDTSEAFLFNVSQPFGVDDKDDKREMDIALDEALAWCLLVVVAVFRGADLIIDFEFDSCLTSQRNAYLNQEKKKNLVAPRLHEGIGNGSRISIIIVFLIVTLGTVIHARYQIINENIFIPYEGWDPSRAVGKPETISLHFNGDVFSGFNLTVVILVGCHLFLAVLAALADNAMNSGVEIFLITQKPLIRSFIATVVLGMLSINVGQMAVFNHEITFLVCALLSYYIVDTVGANFL